MLGVAAEDRDVARAARAREQTVGVRTRRALNDGLSTARTAAGETYASACGLEAELHAEAFRREEAEHVAAACETLGVLQGTLATIESQPLAPQSAVGAGPEADREARTLQLHHVRAHEAADRGAAAVAADRRAERDREAERRRDELALSEAAPQRERAVRRAERRRPRRGASGRRDEPRRVAAAARSARRGAEAAAEGSMRRAAERAAAAVPPAAPAWRW